MTCHFGALPRESLFGKRKRTTSSGLSSESTTPLKLGVSRRLDTILGLWSE